LRAPAVQRRRIIPSVCFQYNRKERNKQERNSSGWGSFSWAKKQAFQSSHFRDSRTINSLKLSQIWEDYVVCRAIQIWLECRILCEESFSYRRGLPDRRGGGTVTTITVPNQLLLLAFLCRMMTDSLAQGYTGLSLSSAYIASERSAERKRSVEHHEAKVDHAQVAETCLS
jgi:hypothetical protein